MKRIICLGALAVVVLVGLIMSYRLAAAQQQTDVQLPATALKFGVFVARFDPGGTYKLEGDRWPTLTGNWKTKGDEIEITTSGGPGGCEKPGRYKVRAEGNRLSFALIADECVPRRMIIDRSAWLPATEVKTKSERKITLTAGARPSKLPTPNTAQVSWPSFRGAQAAGFAEGQNLPDEWDGKTGRNILWRAPIPGLAHSSPIVWGPQIFVTSAVSSDPKATFRPGL